MQREIRGDIKREKERRQRRYRWKDKSLSLPNKEGRSLLSEWKNKGQGKENWRNGDGKGDRQMSRQAGWTGLREIVQGGGSLKRQQSSLFPDASVCWIQLSVQDVLREGKRGRTGPNKTEKRELRHQEKERWWKTGGRGRGQVIEKSKAMEGKIGIKVISLCHFSKSSKSLLLHFQICPDCIPLLSHHKKPIFFFLPQRSEKLISLSQLPQFKAEIWQFFAKYLHPGLWKIVKKFLIMNRLTQVLLFYAFTSF